MANFATNFITYIISKQTMKKHLLFLICLFIGFCRVNAQWTTIQNGALWRDSDGNDMQAHGSGFLQVGDTFYMIGEDRVQGGVNMYSSKDLVNWKFENKIISKNTCPQLQDGSRFIERPHLIYNKKTNQYVVWLHWEGASYAPAEAGVFYCDKINGNYTFHKGFRPFGNMSRDDNLFVDDDDKAYFVSATNHNADLIIYELTDDYLDVKTQVITLWRGGYREAPVIIKKDGVYFLFSSGCTGWEPNQGQYAYATSLKGPWSNRINIANKMTYDTQPTCILPIRGTEGTTYVYIGDRWQDPSLAESKTIMLPLTFNGTDVRMNYYHKWSLNLQTGKWRAETLDNAIPKTGWKLKYVSSQEANSASMAFDGNKNTMWHTKYSGGVDRHPHEIQIDLGQEYTFSGLLCTPRQDSDVNGVIRNFLFFTSKDGKDWGSPVAGGWMTWQSEIAFNEVTARYIRLVAYSEFGNNAYTSIAEIDLLKNCSAPASTITPYIKINESNWTEIDSIRIKKGNTFKFGPQSNGRGSWAIYGPGGFVSFNRDTSIDLIDIKHSGKYTLLFLNQYNRITSDSIEIEVTENTDIEKEKLLKAITKARSVYYEDLTDANILLDTINTAWETYRNRTATAQEMDEMRVRVYSAINSYIMTNIKKGKDISADLTTYQDFKSKKPEGWSCTELTNASYGCAEYYNKNFTFSQTLENLKPGYYIFGVQGFYREGANNGGSYYEFNKEDIKAKLFFGVKTTELNSIYSIKYEGTGSKNGYCDNMKSASTLFADTTTNYANWIVTYLNNDNVTLGIKKTETESEDWCCFNNFTLCYLGESPDYVHDISKNTVKSGEIYTLQGIYVGNQNDANLRLKPGIYICNNKLLYIRSN